MHVPIPPFTTLPSNPVVAALPKADLHLHQEWGPRLDRVLARREGRPPYDWRTWAERLMRDTPRGVSRLERLAPLATVPPELDAAPENFVDRIADLLEEAAADGAVLAEVRFGNETVLRPDFMALFREAERRVQVRYRRFRAVALVSLILWSAPDQIQRILEACLAAQREGLSGVDLLYRPYATEADWDAIYRIADRAAEAGLGITAHAGEFSIANIEAALKAPGLTRLGHAVYAERDPRLLDLVAKSGVTVECSLSCNVVLGAVPSYEAHPIQRFVARGIPIVLCTDNPVQICTTIGREYAIAHARGFSTAVLLGFTRNAIRASFATPERKAAMLAELRAETR